MIIGELAAALSVSTKTLRLYEERGLIPTPARSGNGYRFYGDVAVQRARLVVGLRGLGLSLDEIEKLVGALGRKDRSVRGELGGVLHERIRVLAEEIAVRQGQLDDLESRYLSLVETERGKTGDCICGALQQKCACVWTGQDRP